MRPLITLRFVPTEQEIMHSPFKNMSMKVAKKLLTGIDDLLSTSSDAVYQTQGAERYFIGSS